MPNHNRRQTHLDFYHPTHAETQGLKLEVVRLLIRVRIKIYDRVGKSITPKSVKYNATRR